MIRYRPTLINRKEVVMAEDESGNWTSLSDYYTLHDRLMRAEGKIAALAAEVEWLRKADRLVCWNEATQQWEIRHEHRREGRDDK